MKVFLFHGFTVARLGLESFFHIAIIETNFDKNLITWRKYHYGNSQDENWNQIEKEYYKVFRSKERKKYDYSKFLSNDERNELIKRWNKLSNVGNHIHFVQTALSHKIITSTDNDKLQSSLFDTEIPPGMDGKSQASAINLRSSKYLGM